MKQSDRSRHLKICSESAFSELCARSGLAATPPKEDENGWDFFVEFPPNKKEHISMDKQAPSIKCLVQVKATDSLKNLSLSISLSTLDKLARATLPAFIAIFDYCRQDKYNAIYICHLGKERLEQILCKVRRIDNEGKRGLHHSTMVFRARQNEIISTASGADFGALLLSYTGQDLAVYSRHKSDIIEKVGFAERPIILKISTETKIETLVDAMLGLKEISIDEALVLEERFGIQVVQHRLHAGILKVDPHPGASCKIYARNEVNGEDIEIDATVIAPQIPNLSYEKIKLRVSAPLIEVIVSFENNSGSIILDIDPEKSYRFDDLAQATSLYRIASDNDSSLEFRKNGRVFARAVMPAFGKLASYNLLSERMKTLGEIIHKSRYRGSFEVRPRDLMDDDEAFQWLDLGIVEGENQVSCSFSADMPCFENEGIIAAVIPVKCDSCVMCFFIYWDAKLVIDGNNMTATLSRSSVRKAVRVRKGEEEDLKDQMGKFETLCKKASETWVFLGLDVDGLFNAQVVI